MVLIIVLNVNHNRVEIENYRQVTWHKFLEAANLFLIFFNFFLTESVAPLVSESFIGKLDASLNSWDCSSIGRDVRLILGRSRVRSPAVPTIFYQNKKKEKKKKKGSGGYE